MIHLFHGFLGTPDDLSFFNQLGPITTYDMTTFDDSRFTCGPEDVLIGYSMGGRVALKIARRMKYNFKKIIILSSNPMALNEEERSARMLWEESIKERMLNLSSHDFLTYWNALSLFKDDAPLETITQEDLIKWASIFEKYRLSGQGDYLSDLANHQDKFSWIVGSLDEKYLSIAKTSGLPFHTIKAGHRLFQHPEQIIELIKKEKIL